MYSCFCDYIDLHVGMVIHTTQISEVNQHKTTNDRLKQVILNGN